MCLPKSVHSRILFIDHSFSFGHLLKIIFSVKLNSTQDSNTYSLIVTLIISSGGPLAYTQRALVQYDGSLDPVQVLQLHDGRPRPGHQLLVTQLRVHLAQLSLNTQNDVLL